MIGKYVNGIRLPELNTVEETLVYCKALMNRERESALRQIEKINKNAEEFPEQHSWLMEQHGRLQVVRAVSERLNLLLADIRNNKE